MAYIAGPGKKGNSIIPNKTLHPGEVIAMEMMVRNLTKNDFAAQLNIKPSQLNELLNGKRPVNASMALHLETLLGIDTEFWMRIQSAYDLAIERQKLKTLTV